MMKKLFTLFVASLVMAPGFAQYKKNLVSAGRQEKTGIEMPAVYNTPVRQTLPATGNKGTGITTAWMNYADAAYLAGFSNLVIAYSASQDSNTVRTNGSYAFYYGFGFSFDPMSTTFQADALNPAAKPPFVVSASDAYTVDSVEIMGFYNRVNPNTSIVDTLYIEVVATGTPQTYNYLYYSGQPTLSNDDTARFCTAVYDRAKNALADSVTGRQVIKKALNAAAYADSVIYGDLGGVHKWKFKLPSPISVTANQKVVAYTHFVSGVPQPLGTPFETSNVWYHATNEPQGAETLPFQRNKERSAGLLMTAQYRYRNVAGGQIGGRSVLTSSLGYANTAQFDYPWYGFRVSCPTCVSVGVGNVNNTMKLGNVFPNPANSTITLPISMKEKANVNVSLSNMIGQTLSTQNLGQLAANQSTSATFSTTNLADGVYFLTVEANGGRTTSRFVVAH